MGESNPGGESEQVAELNVLRRRVAELERALAAPGGGKGLDKPERQLRLILQNMPVMLDAFDCQGNIVVWNAECERVTGYSSEEIVNNPRAMELLYPNAPYRERMVRQWKQRGDAYHDWEWEITCKDGRSKVIQWSNLSDLYPIEGWATWGIGADITSLRKAQQALEVRDQAMASAVSGVAVGDAEGMLTYVNPSFLRMWGYERAEQVVGRSAVEFWQNPADGLAVIEALYDAGSWVGELAAARRDGSTFYAQLSATIVKDEHGDPVCLLGSFVDTTERKKAEETLARFKAVSDKAGHGTAMTDPQGHLIYVNEAFAKMHGFGVGELLGKHLSVIHTAEQMPRINDLIDQLLRDGSLVGEEVWHRRADGTAFPALMNGTLICDDEGRPALLGATAVDMTEHRQMQMRMEEYRDKMTRAERLASLGTLSATLAHKLTQPLSAIQLSIQNALAGLDGALSPEQLRNLLDNALSGVSAATDIVTGVRGFARKSFKNKPTEVSLTAAAGNVMRLLRDSARRAGLEVRFEGVDSLPSVFSDERDVEQLFFVLIQNTVQAARGTRGHRLVIRGALKDEHVELQFCDDCGGIRGEHLDSLFEPFFTTKPVGQGTGLGLPIARDIISRAGGSIRVESEHGVGSTFFVTWPLKTGRAGECTGPSI